MIQELELNTRKCRPNYHTIFYPCIRQEKINKPNNIKENSKKKEINQSNIVKTNDFFCQNEIQISKKIITIPKYSHFFNPVLKNTYIGLSELNDEDFNNEEDEEKDTVAQKYMLLTYRDEYESDFYLYFYNKENQLEPKKYLLHFIDTYKYLLHTIYLLRANDLVHFFINPRNILLDSNNKPFLTNFTKSFYIPELNEERKGRIFEKYEPENYFLPIEVHIICFLNQYQSRKSISLMNIEEVCDAYIKTGLKPLLIFSQEFLEQYKIRAIISLQPFINKHKEEIIKEIIQKNWTTWDNYSLSIMYLSLLKNIFKPTTTTRSNQNIENNPFVVGFSHLLTQNIQSENRQTIQKSASLFTEFLYNVSYKEHIELISFWRKT